MNAAIVTARTAPVGSLSADSATTVCTTFGLTRSRSKSGIRIAGSVGATTAPTIRKPCSKGSLERERRGRSDDERGDHDPGNRQEDESDADLRQHVKRQAEAAVEEDQRDAEREEELRPEPVERDVHPLEHLGPDEDPGAQEDDHARNPEEIREHLGREPDGQQDREDLDDVLRVHGAAFSPSGWTPGVPR